MNMELIIVIAFVYAIIYYVSKKADNVDKKEIGSQSDVQVVSNRTIAKEHKLSENIYDAIEEFARICHNCKRRTDWPYDYRDFATLVVTQNGSSTQLEITCRGDCIAICLPDEYKWLRSNDDDNEIKYVAPNVSGYVKENYGSNIPTEADSLFYFYKKGDPNAVGDQLWQKDNGNIVGMTIRFQ